MPPPEYLARSPIRPLQREDGSLYIEGAEHVNVVSFLDPDPLPDLFTELRLPEDESVLEKMATPRGLSQRRFRAVIADEGPLVVPGLDHLRPWDWNFDTDGQLLTLEHLGGWVIGLMESVYHGHPYKVPQAEGHFLLGVGRLYDSLLADRVWWAIQQGILTGLCGLVSTSSTGDMELLEVSLGRRPVCRNARILSFWEEVIVPWPM